MIDVKKLITGFLVFTVAVSAIAVAFSAIGNRVASSSNPPGVAIIAGAAARGAQQPLAANAFLPQSTLQATSTAIGFGDTSSTAVSTSTNLTNLLAGALLTNIASTNPSGAQTDANGNQTMTSPDDRAIAAQVASSSAFQSVQVPDWDLEAGEQPLHIISTSSPEALNYANGIVAIFKSDFMQNGVESAFKPGQSPDPSIMATVTSSSVQALSDAISLPTPAPAADFQRSFIKLLVYQKNLAALAQNAAQDPAKTYLLLQAEMPKYTAAVQNFKTAFQALSGKDLAMANEGAGAQSQTGALAFLGDVFGVKVAHAQFAAAVFDVVSWAEIVLSYLQEYLIYVQQWIEWIDNIVLQVLKNGFVVLLQSQVTGWVQGAGTPRYEQNWSQTFANVFSAAANGVISQTLPNLSVSFSSNAGVLLSQNSTPIRSNIDQNLAACRCGLNGGGATQQGFYDNFNDGGFSAYLTLFQPDNNIFSAIMDTQDAALSAASNQAAATQAQNVASNGFKGDASCSDGGTNNALYPGGRWISNGFHWSCQDTAGTLYYANVNGAGTVTCDVGTLTQVPNHGLCALGSEPGVQTPGETTAQGVSTAVGSGLQLVVNANNTIDLLFAVANNLLKLISTGSKLASVQPPSAYQASQAAQSVINSYSNIPQHQ